MKSTLMVHRDEYMDVAGAVRSYRRLFFAGKFNRRTHFRDALVFEKIAREKVGRLVSS